MTDHSYKVGDFVKFAGYGDDGQEPVLTKGQICKITELKDGDAIILMPLDGGKGDTAFPEEIEPASEDEVFEASKPRAEDENQDVAEAAPKAKGKGKKAQTKAEPSEDEVAAAKAATKAAKAAAKPKGKAKVQAEEPAEVEAPAEPQGEFAPVIQDTASVRLILEQSKDALEAAKSLSDQVENTYFTLGGVLSHIRATGLHKSLGYDGKRAFNEYVERELGMQYRKAMYLIDIYSKVMLLGVDESRLAEVGWSKVKELIRVASKDNFDDLIDYAKEHNRIELVEHIRTSYAEAGEEASTKVKMTTFKFTLSEESAANAQAALDAAKNLAGTDDLNQCFEHIMSEWRSMTDGVEVTLDEQIRTLEARYGVTLTVSQGEEQAEAGAQEAAE